MADSKYFDEIIKNNKTIENTSIPSGAMSYGEYVESTGGDPSAQLDQSVKKAEQNYRDSVKAAATEYDREIGTYGQKAENVARAGLMHAGYSDYISGEAYASRQRSIDSARAAKQDSIDAAELAAQEANRTNLQGYLGYIENYKAQKKTDTTGAIQTIIGSGLSGDAADSYLSALGFSDDEKQQILGTTEGIVTEQKQKTTYADREAIFGNIVEKGLTGDEAISYAQWVGGLSEADAKAIVALTDAQISNTKAEGVEGNRINALNAVISAGVSGDAAIALIKQYGFDDATAAQIAAAATGVIDKINSDNMATKQAGAIQAIISAGVSGDAAVQFAMGLGLDQATAQAAANAASGVVSKINSDNLESKKAGAIQAIISAGVSGDAAVQFAMGLGLDEATAQAAASAASGVVEKINSENAITRKQGALQSIISLGMTGDEAIEYAKQLGLSDEDASSIAGIADGYAERLAAEDAEIKKQGAIELLLSLGVTGDEAVNLIKEYGFDDATAAQIAAAASGVTEKLKSENAATKRQGVLQNMIVLKMTGEDAKKYAMEIGGLTEAEAEVVAGLAQSYLDKLAAEDSAGKLQTALGNALSMNLSPELAKKYAELTGLDTESAESIADLIEQYRNEAEADEEVNIVNVIGNIATLGLSDFEAVEFARLCGCDEDQVQSISAIADKLAEADADDAMRAALSDIVSLGYTGDKAKKYLSELHSSLSKSDIDTVLSLADDIYSTGNTQSTDTDIKLDFSATGGTLDGFAYLLRAAKDDDARRDINKHAQNDMEAQYAQGGDVAGLIQYWTNSWRSLGYSADEIDAMIELIEKTESGIAYG